MTPLVTCIITAYKDSPETMIQNMLDQSYSNKQLLVFCSDIDIQPLRKRYPQCEFFDVPNRADWGHSKRAMGVSFAEGEYLCFCNADDEYDLRFLEAMMTPLIEEDADLAYCLWTDKTIDNQIANAELELGGVTSGSFVVRTNMAKYVGYHHRVYSADWRFVQDLMQLSLKIIYIPMSLMAHH